MSMTDRLKTAYVTSAKAQHDGGRVEIHLGSAVLEHLRASTIPTKPAWVAQQTLWGFPLITSDDLDPDHLSVHVATEIHP